MRVVHLNTDDSRGGATRSALRLHRALLARGAASEFLVRPGTPAAPYVEWVQEDYLNRRRTGRSPAILSFTFPGVSVLSESRVQAADVLNLHWVAGFLGTDQIGELLGLNKPVVWTLHDQWPMTGGCHYTSGCEQFTDHCRQCPQLQEDEAGLIEASFGDRLETWDSRIVAVCPSQWMARQARASRLFREARIEHIPYSIDHTAFAPRPKATIRQKLGIPVEAFVLLFGCSAGFEKRKGMPLFQALLKELATAGADHVYALFIGWHTANADESPREKHLGFINDDATLCEIYNAADLLVHLASEDNLPNIPLEAMSCGTPVLGLETGGLPEIVKHEESGMLVPAGDFVALVKMALLLIRTPKLCPGYGAAARRMVEEHFRQDLEAARYAALYGELAAAKIAPRGSANRANHVAGRLCELITISARLHTTRRVEENQHKAANEISRLQGELRGFERRLSRAERNIGYRLVNGAKEFARGLGRSIRRRRSTPPG